MKKVEQEKINEKAYTIFNDALKEYKWDLPRKRLRSCQAEVYESDNYYILKSYNTIIACIEKETDTLVDVLRTEYGYTSTSSQHISKFNHDYSKGKWSCANFYRAERI